MYFEKRSTELCTDVVDKTTKAIEEWKRSIGIFLDLSMGFERIDSASAKFRKVDNYSIGYGICQKWFKSYLHSRKQIVKYNDYNLKERLLEEVTSTDQSWVPYCFCYT